VRATATAVRVRAARSGTREAILAATEALLAAGGEDAVAIRAVCARAGVTAPTVYHHFGDKRALIDEVVNARFAEFDRALGARGAPRDPVERLRWGFDRYVAYGVAHPGHYALIFSRAGARPTPAGRASYARLRRTVSAIAEAGRLAAPVDEATPAFWAAVHGITALLIAGFLERSAPTIALVRDAIIAQLTRPAPGQSPRRRSR
jgi:AcrR family transcriptional regulator